MYKFWFHPANGFSSGASDSLADPPSDMMTFVTFDYVFVRSSLPG